VGDPKSDFVPLPGARDEAMRVAAQLKRSVFRVAELIEPTDVQVVEKLHADAYQILHLAGHGVHHHRLGGGAQGLCDACGRPLEERKEDFVSGMIIGEGMVLTPGDVKQMRRVPELVFLNCCHLGRLDAKGRHSDREQQHRLAANLAAEFIRMGVRAVIAAGWAVNDLAALVFAESFYRYMLAGRPYGEAVRLARERTWQEHPAYNTWGAYQCYGDPDFRLRHDGGGPSGGVERTYVSTAEVVADLDNLRADAHSASPSRIQALRDELHRIEKTLDAVALRHGEDWRDQGEVAEALGLAQGEVGRFADAASTLDRAILAEDAGARWNAIEQRARYQARYAKELCLRADAESREKGRALFESALESLKAAERDPRGRLTVERYRSLTGVHWRRVQTLPGRKRVGELSREAELRNLVAVYEQAAADLERGGGDPLDPYSRLLWLAGKLMLGAYSPEQLDVLCPNFAGWCAEIEGRTRRYERESPGASADAIRLEVRLLRLVAEDGLDQVAADELVAELKRVLTRGVSQRQLSSILDYLELLRILAEGATHKKKHFRTQAPLLARIAEALREWQG
jgi:hypothetical protein